VADARDTAPSTEALAERGFDCVREGAFAEALEIAGRLETRQHTAAFDIAAQAHAGIGDLEAAVRTLERGVAAAPDCWLNWQLLGSYRSDLGDFVGAAEAYERAGACDGAWIGSIRLNQAILAGRRGDHAGAVRQLDGLADADLELHAAEVRATALEALGRLDEAASLAEVCLERTRDLEDAPAGLAGLAAALGRVRLARGEPSATVRRFVVEAVDRFAPHEDLFALVRDLDGRTDPDAVYLRLPIHAQREATALDEPRGYYLTYDVIAADTGQALTFVRDFEPPGDTRATLTVEEVERLEPRPGQPLGVCWRTGRAWYLPGEDDEA
jgi:tetratricopeptide (TPR) repeat protein